MTNSLSKRIGRLIAQEFSAFVASLEQSTPGEAMEQALAEIDAAIAEVRTQLGQELASQHHAKARLEAENTKHTALAVEIDQAVAGETHERAKAAIGKQLDMEAQLPILAAHIQEGEGRIQELEQYIRALQARKREMQEEEAMLRQAGPQASYQPIEATAGAAEAKLERASARFANAHENVTGQIPARSLTDIQADARLAELEDVVRSHTITERLAAAKARIQKS